MAIVMGFDIHREQVTFDALDDVTGEVRRGRIAPADRLGSRRFLASLPAGQVNVALEATTGWRFVVEELVAAGASAHLAEPAETANLRGRKAREKTDRADARHLRELLAQGRLPEAWALPAGILELRQRVRLRKTLVSRDEFVCKNADYLYWDAFGYALADHVRHRNSPAECERRKLEAAKRRQRRAVKTVTQLKLAA